MERAATSAQREALRAGYAVPLVRWVLADTETPVTAFAKLRRLGARALLESVEGGERWGRFSVIGLQPRHRLVVTADGTVRLDDEIVVGEGDPFTRIAPLVEGTRLATELLDPSLPRFLGGWIGYVGYGAVHWIEPSVPDTKPEPTPFPEVSFYEFDTAVLFDNVRHAVAVVATVVPEPDLDPDAAIVAGWRRIDAVVEALRESAGLEPILYETPTAEGSAEFTPTMSREAFERAVVEARESILAGEAIQVVLSQRFLAPRTTSAFALYRALRVLNPSPYMFYLEFPEGALVGSSPEVLVRKEGRRATVRPIAGTRRRGRTPEEDLALERELLADPKELAEHVMLVDLGRNDLGRVAAPGTVRVTERMVIERYSHVMHIVSNVEAELREGLGALDLLRATFPAGTVTGAPKVRAMQLIDELETVRRGPYAGAVGYFDYRGDMDTCITIRTFFVWDDLVAVHVGAGIVADSQPDLEYQETLNKAAALFAAVRLVEAGFALETP